jgi:hypothetical protein
MFSFLAISTQDQASVAESDPLARFGASIALAANRGVGDSASDGKETVPAASFLAPGDSPRYEQLRLRADIVVRRSGGTSG